jgi:hypothetical protein
MYRRAQPVFYAFDLVWLGGEDLRELPLLKRKRRCGGSCCAALPLCATSNISAGADAICFE